MNRLHLIYSLIFGRRPRRSEETLGATSCSEEPCSLSRRSSVRVRSEETEVYAVDLLTKSHSVSSLESARDCRTSMQAKKNPTAAGPGGVFGQRATDSPKATRLKA
jgi:hypothetical protein